MELTTKSIKKALARDGVDRVYAAVLDGLVNHDVTLSVNLAELSRDTQGRDAYTEAGNVQLFQTGFVHGLNTYNYLRSMKRELSRERLTERVRESSLGGLSNVGSLIGVFGAQMLATSMFSAYDSALMDIARLATEVDTGANKLGAHVCPSPYRVKPINMDAIGHNEVAKAIQVNQTYSTIPGPTNRRSQFQISIIDQLGDNTRTLDTIGAQTGQHFAQWENDQTLGVLFGFIKNGATIEGSDVDTYQTNATSSTTTWDNKITSYSWTDYTSLNAVFDKFALLTDPISGLPVVSLDKIPHCVTVVQNRSLMYQMMNSTTYRRGNTATSGGVQGEFSDPWAGLIGDVITSQAVNRALTANSVSSSDLNKYFFFGDISKVVGKRTVYDFQIQPIVNTMNPLNFLVGYEVGLYKVYFPWERRAGVLCTS